MFGRNVAPFGVLLRCISQHSNAEMQSVVKDIQPFISTFEAQPVLNSYDGSSLILNEL